MNLSESAAVHGSAAVRAVRAAVCGSAHGSVRASVRLAVCSSGLGKVWQCARQCVAVRQCGRVQKCGILRQFAVVRQCGFVPQYVAVCGSARGSVWQFALRVLLHKVAHNAFIGAVGVIMSPTFLAY
jgi:hypothetical protein